VLGGGADAARDGLVDGIQPDEPAGYSLTVADATRSLSRLPGVSGEGPAFATPGHRKAARVCAAFVPSLNHTAAKRESGENSTGIVGNFPWH
jgi:hypothetical protein